MTINTTGIVSNENNKITEAGTYVLKIVKVEEDGFEKYKLSFEGKKALEGGKLSDETYSMLDWLQLSDNLIWKVARIRDALKSPEIFDLNDWVNRYVVAVIEMNTYNDKTNPQFKQLKYSSFNDNMPPIQEAKSEQSVDANVQPENAPTIDVDSDSIPF